MEHADQEKQPAHYPVTYNKEQSVSHLIACNFPVERLWVAKQHFFQDVHVLL